MYLADTSAWIGFLRGQDIPAVHLLRQLLLSRITVFVTGIVYQEILQGADSNRRFREFQAYFGSQRFVHPNDLMVSYAAAARIYFDCRRRGVTIRASADCLIARIAIEHELTLIHNDSDFVRIGRVIPRLKHSMGE